MRACVYLFIIAESSFQFLIHYIIEMVTLFVAFGLLLFNEVNLGSTVSIEFLFKV